MNRVIGVIVAVIIGGIIGGLIVLLAPRTAVTEAAAGAIGMFVTLLTYRRFERTTVPLPKFVFGTAIASLGAFVLMWMIWAR
jgi:glycerol uptake facilitator-like aquaporin